MIRKKEWRQEEEVAMTTGEVVKMKISVDISRVSGERERRRRWRSMKKEREKQVWSVWLERVCP